MIIKIILGIILGINQEIDCSGPESEPGPSCAHRCAVLERGPGLDHVNQTPGPLGPGVWFTKRLLYLRCLLNVCLFVVQRSSLNVCSTYVVLDNVVVLKKV